jgi:hypothetical protein
MTRPVARSARTRSFPWILPVVVSCLLAAPLAAAAEAKNPPLAGGAATDSPFGDYRSWRDEPVADWSTANSRVGEIGGWLTYLQEAQTNDGEANADEPNHHGHHGH